MGITPEYVKQLWQERSTTKGPVLARMKEVRDMADGDVIIPLNELDRQARASVANLLINGLEQMSMRVASTTPMPYWPPLVEGQKRSENKARLRREANLVMWDRNRLPMKLRRRARHLLGYAESAVYIKPDFTRAYDGPRWFVRNPLDTFPCPRTDPDDPVPNDCVFAYMQSIGWLLDRYPNEMMAIDTRNMARDAKFQLLEYVDADEMVLVVVGREPDSNGYGEFGQRAKKAVLLERIPNLAKRPLVVDVNRISLNIPRGQFDGTVGMHYTRARLDALTLIAIERGIFPETYLVANPGENAEVRETADARLGQIGVVTGGRLETLQINPGYKTTEMLDRLERQERLEGGIPAEFGGESPTNIRTGRRGETILSATIDFRVQEAQATFQDSLLAEDQIAVAIEKAWWGKVPRSFFIPGRNGVKIDYIPNEIWETDVHTVRYPAAGSDVNNLMIMLGQALGIGIMSRSTAMELNPAVEDPEREKERLLEEGINAALLNSIQQQAADPAGPYQPDDLAYLVKLVVEQKQTLFDAVEATQKRAQERQAQAAPAGAPATMPGLAAPGMGAEQPTIPPPAQGVQNLASMLTSLRRPAAVAEAMTPGGG